MPKPTYKELWNRIKNLEKDNHGLKQTVVELQAKQQQKKTEAALAASERSYRELVESANSIILRLDLVGNIKFINSFAQKFFGYPEKEILGENVVGTIVPETESSGRNLAAMIKDLGLHPERYINNENENIKSGGQKVWIAWTNKGIQNEAGNISEILCVGNDISQRRESEKALIEKEALLRTAIESLPFDFFALDETGRYIMQNSTCKKQWGDIMGKRPEDLGIDKDTLALWQSNNRRAFAGEVVEGEVALRPNGKEGFYYNIISPIHDDDRIRGILGVNIDITRPKRAEKALRESEAKFRALAESAPAAILIVAGEKFLYVNPAFELIAGFSREEALTMRFWQVVHPDMREFVRERESARQRGEAVPQRYELKALTKDGQTKWIDLVAKTIKYGGQTATLATAYDITERKRTENALQEAYCIINRSPAVAFLWKNLEGWPVEFVSDNVMELFGYTAEEFTSGQKVYAETVHPDDLERLENEVATFSSEKEKTDFVHKPYRIISKDGKIKWLDDRTFIRRDNKGNITHYEGVVVDITENMQTAQILQENKEKLARSKKMESLGLLAGGVAHDLNNVLAGIVSYPELLLLELPENSPFREAIQTIKKSGDRAVAIVQDLLTVARGVATAKEPLNLNDLIGDYLHSPEFNKLKQFHPTVTVKTNLDTDLLNISGSHVHIRKVVMNLVSNASEAINGSGNVIISTVNRYVDTPLRGYDDINAGEYAVLAVSDDGSGISSDDLERIFEPFYTKKVMGRSGTGLGLAVVWNVIQDHRGYIDVTSNKDGTMFELFFPITREEISAEDFSIPFDNLKGDGQKILVVDDVASQRDISCKMLEIFGYKTKAVSSGKEAVEYLKNNTVDLVLLDMIMDPGINGRETYERIIKIHPNQKAIIVSGFAETDDVKETQKLGAGKYVKKPLTLEKLGMDIKEELSKPLSCIDNRAKNK